MPIDLNQLNSESVKEVSMVSNFIFMSYDKYWYRDLLRISKHWSSYRRINFHTSKITDEWSYQSTSKERELDWIHLVDMVLDLFKNEKSQEIITDTSEFNIRITLTDGSHIDHHFYRGFAENGFRGLSHVFKLLIPSEESAYPDVIDIIPLFLHSVPLTAESIKEVKKEDLCVMMYAEGGAMGCPGEMCALDTHGNKFYVDGIYSGSKDQISQIEAIDTLFEDLQHQSGIGAPPVSTVRLNGGMWIYLYLGMGNHLYLRHDFWDEHGPRVFSTEPPKMYRNWKNLIREE